MTVLSPNAFNLQQPTDGQAQAMVETAAAFADLAGRLEDLIPDGPDKTYTLRQLRECAMWAAVAITRNADGSLRAQSSTTAAEDRIAGRQVA